MDENPKSIYIFSGKRKCGKDYFTDRLYSKLGQTEAVIIKLSAPIKQLHSEQNGLDYKALLSASEYKEAHRKSMLEWSQKVRNENYGYFCKEAIKMSKAKNYAFWIVSDARRKTDIRWFKENYSNVIIKIFRIVCDDSIREQRGWAHTKGIDDEETECGLDDFIGWDEIIKNDSTSDIDSIINSMVQSMSFLSCDTANEMHTV